MPLKFTTKEKRDAAAERLLAISNYMLQSMDQGGHNQISVDMNMVEDIRMAACIVGLCEIQPIDQQPKQDRS